MKQVWDQFQSDRSISNFENFYHSTIDLVTRIIFRSVQDVERSEDIAQALYARIWEDQLRKIPDGCTVEQAIVQWTFNEIRTAKRRWEKQGNREVSMEQGYGVDQVDADAREMALEQLMGEKVRSIISTLPEKYRQVLIVCDLEGYSQKEAGQILNLPTQTVKTQVNRARKLLEKKLRKAGITSSVGVALVVLKGLPVQALNLSIRNMITNSRLIVEQAGPVVPAPVIGGAGVMMSLGLFVGVALILLVGVWIVLGRGGGSFNDIASVPDQSVHIEISENDVPKESAFNQSSQAMDHQEGDEEDPFEDFVPSPEIRGVFKGKVFSDAVNEKPVAGATVSVYSMGAGYRHQLIEQCKTDSSGCYRFMGLPIENYSIDIFHGDYQCVSESVDFWWSRQKEHSLVLDGEELVLTKNYCLMPGGKQLIGTIVHFETGEPIVGAEVFINKGWDFELNTKSDQSGMFVFDNLQDDRYHLTVSHDQMEAFYLTSIQPQDGILISMKPGRTFVQGMVIEKGTGRPLADSLVSVCKGKHWLVTKTNENGLYQFPPMPRGVYSIRAESGDVISSRVGKEVFLGSNHHTWVDLSLPKERTVRGIVVDKLTGLPLENILVRNQEYSTAHMFVPTTLCVTDHQGRYELTSASEKLFFYRDLSDQIGFSEKVRGVSAGEEPVINEHRWTPVKTQDIHLTVIDQEGNPVQGARVWIHQSHYQSYLRGVTDSNGVFKKSFPAYMDCRKNFTCTVYKEGVGYYADVVNGEGMGSGIHCDLTLKTGEDLTVCLMDQNGNYHSLLDCSFMSQLGEKKNYGTFDLNRQCADESGMVTFRNVPLEYKTNISFRTAYGPGGHQVFQPEEIDPDRLIVFILEDHIQEIKGRVITSQGVPIEDVVVSRAYSYHNQSDLSNEFGQFSLLVDIDQEVTLNFSKEGYLDKRLTKQDIHDVSDFQVVLERGTKERHTIYGHVFREDGTPHSGSVEFRLMNHAEYNDKVVIGVSEDGEYEIDLSADFFNNNETPVLVMEMTDNHDGIGRSKAIPIGHGGETGPIDLTLSWHELSGKVLCSDNNEPVEGAWIKFQHQDDEEGFENIDKFNKSQGSNKSSSGGMNGSPSTKNRFDPVQFEVRTDANGCYKIAPFPAGEYKVSVSHCQYGSFQDDQFVVSTDEKFVENDFHLGGLAGLRGKIISTPEILDESWFLASYKWPAFSQKISHQNYDSSINEGVAPYWLSSLSPGKDIIYLSLIKLREDTDYPPSFLYPYEVCSSGNHTFDLTVPDLDAEVQIQDPDGHLEVKNRNDGVMLYLLRPWDESSATISLYHSVGKTTSSDSEIDRSVTKFPSGKYTVIKFKYFGRVREGDTTQKECVDKLYDLLTGPMPDGKQVYFSSDERNVLKIE